MELTKNTIMFLAGAIVASFALFAWQVGVAWQTKDGLKVTSSDIVLVDEVGSFTHLLTSIPVVKPVDAPDSPSTMLQGRSVILQFPSAAAANFSPGTKVSVTCSVGDVLPESQ